MAATAADAGSLVDSEQHVAHQSAALSLAFGKIEYSPTPRNSFYFKKSVAGAPTLITLNCSEMLNLLKVLPDAMNIAHMIESRNEASFEKKLMSEFPDLDIDDGSSSSKDTADDDDEEEESESSGSDQTQNRMFSKMIQEKGQNFVSLDVSKYKGRSYI